MSYFGDSYPESEFDVHANDSEWFDEGDELYEEILDKLSEDFPGVMDQTAADMLYQGWFDPDTDRYDRPVIWFEFFDYTGLDWEDFDWDSWREWYES